jgi:hypothetical protein
VELCSFEKELKVWGKSVSKSAENEAETRLNGLRMEGGGR